MNCPRCKTALNKKTIVERKEEIELDVCPSCDGIWFDPGELNSLDHITEPVLIEFRDIPSAYDQLTALFCPKCEDHPLMKKAEHPRDEKVILDYCEHCNSIWLDHGELAAIQKESWVLTIFNLWKKL